MQLVERARGGTDISSFPRHVFYIIYLVLTIGLAWLVGVWFGNTGSLYTGVSAQLCCRRWRIACSRWLYAARLGGFPSSAFYSSTIHSQLPRLPLCTGPPRQDMVREEKQDQYHPLPVFAPLTSSLCSAVDDSCIDESEREITLNFLMKHVITK